MRDQDATGSDLHQILGDMDDSTAVAILGAYPTCEADVVCVLTDLLHKRRDYAERDGERFMDAVQNARLITNAERYYIASCTMARAHPGICATATCSKP